MEYFHDLALTETAYSVRMWSGSERYTPTRGCYKIMRTWVSTRGKSKRERTRGRVNRREAGCEARDSARDERKIASNKRRRRGGER